MSSPLRRLRRLPPELLRCSAGATLALLAVTRPSTAQDTVPVRACLVAQRVLTSPGQARVDDIRALANCRGGAEPAVVSLWQRASQLPPVALATLVEVSRGFAHLDVQKAVAARVADHSTPQAVRLGGLAVQTTALDARSVTTAEDLLQLPGGRSLVAALHTPHGRLVATPAEQRAVLAQWAQLADADPDSTVRAIALALRQLGAFRAPQYTPIRDDAVVMHATCATRVAVENREDIPLGVTLRVIGTPVVRAYTLPPHGVVGAVPLLLELPEGPVVVTFAGREIARLSVRPTRACNPGETGLRKRSL